MPRLSLTWKIFLATAGVVSAVLVGALVLTSLSARKTADESIGRGLAGTRQRIRTILDARGQQMTGAARVFADNPDFRSLVLEARAEDMLDQSDIAGEQIDA